MSPLENIRFYMKLLQARVVFFLDERLKRDPKVVDRLEYMKISAEQAQRMLQNPKMAKALPPGMAEQVKMMNQSLPMLERELKKNSSLTMSQLKEISQNPERMQPRVRTRPGPPMKTRRR